MMRKFRKNKLNSDELKMSEQELKSFFRMLMKFKKRHPNFNAKLLFDKLYPNSDFNNFE
jgi:hypothetical protein